MSHNDRQGDNSNREAFMKKESAPFCRKVLRGGREAYELGNDLIRLVTLVGGGHIAELRFAQHTGHSTINPLWKPPWKAIEPDQYRAEKHSAVYGSPAEGRLLAGIAGHNLCLDHFGPPSEEEVAQGLSIHGEAGVLRWKKVRVRATSRQAALTLQVKLPLAGLVFQRELRILTGESVVYVREAVKNLSKRDHIFDWQQHVTLGPPFLSPPEGRIALPGTRGKVFPGGYEGKDLLVAGSVFQWPRAPRMGGGTVDLSYPFTRKGHGILSTVLLDPRRTSGYIAAWNARHQVLIGYVFRRADFPWVMIWEENQARRQPPWNGRCQSRGLEFGSSPFPVTRREALRAGPLFGASSFAVVPAKATRSVSYLAFLAPLARNFQQVHEVRVSEGSLTVYGTARSAPITVAASRAQTES
jgi:hypothetical protein